MVLEAMGMEATDLEVVVVVGKLIFTIIIT